jgi:hypothetical protein
MRAEEEHAKKMRVKEYARVKEEEAEDERVEKEDVKEMRAEEDERVKEEEAEVEAKEEIAQC